MERGGLVSLGFVVVTPFVHQGWEDKSVPPIFYTPCACLCEIYPAGYWLGWNGGFVGTAQYDTLGLTPEQGAELSDWLQSLFYADRWGFDGVFVHREDAQEFIRRWTSGFNGLKLLEMALPIQWLEEYLNIHRLEDNPDIPQGRYYQGRHLAARLKRPPLPGLGLGFEVLGVSHWGDAHTSACSDARQKFRVGFGATFNAHGFLTTLEQAELAAREYMVESDGSGIEDCVWFPIQVLEVQAP